MGIQRLKQSSFNRYMSVQAPFASAPSYVNAKSTLFDGVNDYVDLGEPADIGVTLNNHEFTVAGWIYPTSLVDYGYVFAKARPFVPAIHHIVAVSAAGVLFAYAGDVSKLLQSSASAITINTWQHVAFTVRNISGTYTANIWKNGVKQGSDVTAPGSGVDAGTSVRIGAGSNAGAAAYPFPGYMDEVTYWSVGLTAAELLELYNSGHPADATLHSRASVLTHYYRMGDTGDTFPTITDRKASSNGTCTGMTSGAVNFITTVP